ncbi:MULTISPECIES: hypothetical protein [unclassified Bradyrhizobium]|uniref:hypothetical protein n=1 Tax=unclassified Bradyrhizobium TaxID=2631580 RepID=UPI0028E1EEAA|nr:MULTISPECIES: hypothetical protein [unclassified Bradyrhizobium]
MTQKKGYAELSKLPVPDETMPSPVPERIEHDYRMAAASPEPQITPRVFDALARESSQEFFG